ncbi:MAG: outer membrane beta-barrel protein [Bacteroidota bacterium]|nr:outer membrane beta-barrel protein [Bacteroidota bacterium]
MKYLFFFIGFLISFQAHAQTGSLGVLIGDVLDERKKALEGATIQLISLQDSTQRKSTLTDKNGSFFFNNIPFGFHKIHISFVGLQSLTIDSVHFRAERFDFNLNDITLKAKTSESLDEVVVYAEKPLIQSTEGNITFNAGESALSAGSNVGELLTNVPLVTKDPSGKLLIRGKEPKILIDEKPVELNQQQLQDLLESLPGSSIEKIEVMTNPPPQYANEQGGVINITTKKGKVGKSGRLTLSAGTRGEASLNGNFNYRKQGFAANINAGAGYNEFTGEGYSERRNVYIDSSNLFRTQNVSENKNLRPNLRANFDYDLNKFNAFNLVLNYNQNGYNNEAGTQFRNINRFNSIYRLSQRTINSDGESHNPAISLSYTLKTKKAGEIFKFISNLNLSRNQSNRHFYQEYFNPDFSPKGIDSTQQQVTNNRTKGHHLRFQYDVPLKNKKTFLSAGSFHTVSNSHIKADAEYLRKSDFKWIALSALTNEFKFHQSITNMRGSVKQILGKNFSATAGLSAEMTRIHFDLYKAGIDARNNYWSFLPFGNINKNWKDVLNLTFSYRRTIRRPGVVELNPTIDSSDAYNLRSGNTTLMPSLSHNFDMVAGKTKKQFYANLGLGYNIVDDVFNQIRLRLSDTITQITWQNISGKKEYEISSWSGYTVSKKMKINLSASYTHNEYSRFDKETRKFRDGGSFTSNINTNYNWKELYNLTGSFTFNRFANPQGTVRSNLSMNIGFQAKILAKKMTATLNVIDPFRQQQSKTFTYGTNFTLESFNTTQTKNIRLTVSYNFTNATKRKPNAGDKNKQQLQKILKSQMPKT